MEKEVKTPEEMQESDINIDEAEKETGKMDKEEDKKAKFFKYQHPAVTSGTIVKEVEKIAQEEDGKVRFFAYQNPAIIFGTVVRRVEKIAQESNIPTMQAYDDLISDLRNYYNEGAKKNFQNITLVGLTPNMINKFIEYIDKIKKVSIKKENQQSNKSKKESMKAKCEKIKLELEESALNGEQGTKEEIIERLISDINNRVSRYELGSKEKKYIVKQLQEELDELKREESENRSVEEMIKKMDEILDEKSLQGEIKNKVEYWTSIRKAITGKKNNNEFNINVGKTAETMLLEMIDERISIEKDQRYYNQVKEFTNNFQFLRQYGEIRIATNGNRKIKFTDRESYDRFCSLRSSLQKGYSEYKQISELLNEGNMSEADIRILNARKSVMDKERNNKQKPDGAR